MLNSHLLATLAILSPFLILGSAAATPTAVLQARQDFSACPTCLTGLTTIQTCGNGTTATMPNALPEPTACLCTSAFLQDAATCYECTKGVFGGDGTTFREGDTWDDLQTFTASCNAAGFNVTAPTNTTAPTGTSANATSSAVPSGNVTASRTEGGTAASATGTAPATGGASVGTVVGRGLALSVGGGVVAAMLL